MEIFQSKAMQGDDQDDLASVRDQSTIKTRSKQDRGRGKKRSTQEQIKINTESRFAGDGA
jgi:hypothetical protein